MVATRKLCKPLLLIAMSLMVLTAVNAAAVDSDGDLFDDDYEYSMGTDPGNSASYPSLPVTGFVQHVVEADETSRTYFEVEIGEGFLGTLPGPTVIEVTRTDPGGNVTVVPLPAYEYLSMWRDFSWELPGEPSLGVYTFNVTYGIYSGSDTDYQYTIRYLPGPAAGSFAPADGQTITSSTPSFSWGAVEYTPPSGEPNPPIYYRLEVTDTPDATGRVFASSYIYGMTSFTLPAGVLTPGETYYWRVRFVDGAGWLNYMNRRNGQWRSFTMANTLTHAAIPAIDTDGWGVVSYNRPQPAGTASEAWVRIYDHDGVASDGSSHTVTVKRAGDPTEYRMNFSRSEGNYSAGYDLWTDGPPPSPGEYTFKVVDPDGRIGTFTETVTAQDLASLPPPDENSVEPSVIGESIRVRYDNIVVDNVPYENFDSYNDISELDAGKWGWYGNASIARNNGDGWLILDLGNSVGRSTGNLNFQNPESISSIQADVSIEGVNGTNGGAEIRGVWCNNGIGDISAKLRIDGNGITYDVVQEYINEHGTFQWDTLAAEVVSTGYVLGQTVTLGIEWIEPTSTLRFTVDGEPYDYAVTGVLGPPIFETVKQLRTRINLVFDDTTPTFTWDEVPGAARYRIRIFNYDNNNRLEIWRDTFGATGTGQVSVTIPPGVLRPDSLYRYRIEAWDAPSPLNVNSVSRIPFYTSNDYQFYTGQIDDTPHITSFDNGVYVWNNEILEPFLNFLVVVHDVDGVPGTLRVWVEPPVGDPEDLVFRPDFYFSPATPTSGIYYKQSNETPVDGGIYTFYVDDGVTIHSFSEELALDPIGYPTAASMRPLSGSTIGSTAVNFSWEAVDDVTFGQGYYRLDIFDYNFNRLHRFHTTDNSFNLPPGYLKAGTLYRWRIQTLREYYSDNVDNGSSSSANFYDMPTFVTTPPPDTDRDGLPDEWELSYWSRLNQYDGLGDADGDGLSNSQEYIRGTNPTLADTDGDGQPDGSDPFPLSTNEVDDSDGDGLPDNTDPCPLDRSNDALDGDGVCGDVDNCPSVANPDQADLNGDGWGDACDDIDQDGIADYLDAWPIDPQNDLDGDGYGADPYGNCKEICPGCSELAAICSSLDNCPGEPNPDQSINPCEPEGSGVPPACHPIKNPCDPPLDDSAAEKDSDADGVPDSEDNCANLQNPYDVDTNGDGRLDAQLNTDNDAYGDPCDDDDDNDGTLDAADNCPLIANSDQADLDGDGLGDVCDVDIDGDDWNNEYEIGTAGTSPTNRDTDGDKIPDNTDPDPLTPAGETVYRIVLSAPSTWIPSLTWDETAQRWVPDEVAVTAQFKAPDGTTVPFPDGATVSLTLTPSTWEGVAVNDTEEYADQPSNDFSFDRDNKDSVNMTIKASGANSVSFPLYAFDFGGQAMIEASVSDGHGGTALGKIRLPVDSDEDLLPDEWERSQPGFNALDANTFSALKLDGDADIDTSLNNSYTGDGLSNFNEYRGIVLDRINNGKVAYTFKRLNSRRKDLFVRGDNFANSTLKSYTAQAGTVLSFSVDHGAVYENNVPSAFEEAEIDIHDVTGMPSFSQENEPPHIDVLVVTNRTETRTDGLIQTLPTNNSLGIEDGFINHPSTLMPRYWTWDLKGASYVGNNQFYAISDGGTIATHTYHLSMMHYFHNRPYLKDLSNAWKQCNCYSDAYDSKLLPMDMVEDYYRENGTGPDSKGKINEDRCLQNTSIDGDRMDPDWRNVQNGSFTFEAGRDYSVFDEDGDGRVELPVLDDPFVLNSNGFDLGREYTIEQVQLHTALHEMGHAVGMDAQHTTDPTCLMYQESNNWSRANHFCPYAQSQILIHNKTEVQ